VLKAQAAADALSEVRFGGSEPLGERRLFTQSEPPDEPARAENAFRIELLLHAPHQLERRRRIAEDVDALLYRRWAALYEAGSGVFRSDSASAI
jgi:hypothetical protein